MRRILGLPLAWVARSLERAILSLAFMLAAILLERRVLRPGRSS
jgi:hypothetical protein